MVPEKLDDATTRGIHSTDLAPIDCPRLLCRQHKLLSSPHCQIFSSADSRELADKLVALLQSWGIRCYIDEHPNDDPRHEIDSPAYQTSLLVLGSE